MQNSRLYATNKAFEEKKQVRKRRRPPRSSKKPTIFSLMSLLMITMLITPTVSNLCKNRASLDQEIDTWRNCQNSSCFHLSQRDDNSDLQFLDQSYGFSKTDSYHGKPVFIHTYNRS